MEKSCRARDKKDVLKRTLLSSKKDSNICGNSWKGGKGLKVKNIFQKYKTKIKHGIFFFIFQRRVNRRERDFAG